MAESQEYLKREFIHQISNSLALLGAGEDIVNKIRQVEEKPLTPQIITDLMNFNNEWGDKIKGQLSLCSSITIQPKG